MVGACSTPLKAQSAFGPAGGGSPGPGVSGLEIARGATTGVSPILLFGRNPDLDVGTEDLWAQGGNFVPPTAARVHALVSTSANDTAAGTGARTVFVEGLDSAFALASETVTLNGATPVNTVSSYTMIHRLTALTAGSGDVNAGAITATAAVDATVTCGIMVSAGRSQQAIFQIPAGKTGYLIQIQGGLQGGGSGAVDLFVFAKPFGGAFTVLDNVALDSVGASALQINYMVPLVVTEKTIIKLRGTSSAVNLDVMGSFVVLLIDN